jgi:putative acetyltransferase
MIRKYQPADCEDVLNVWAQASALAHPFLSQAFLAVERHMIPNVYLPTADTWVWEADGRVVGFISLIGNEVGALFVDPAFHRSGIGRALVAQARGLRGALEVEVFERNLAGTLGFELLHQKVHDQTGFDILRLRLAADIGRTTVYPGRTRPDRP